MKRVKLLHGVYIRVSGDSGQPIGASAEYVERIVDGAEIVSARLLDPEPLTVTPDVLAPLIGEAVTDLTGRLAERDAALDAAREGLTERDARLSDLTAQAEDQAGQIARQAEALAALGGTLAEREAQLAEARAALDVLEAQKIAAVQAGVKAEAWAANMQTRAQDANQRAADLEAELDGVQQQLTATQERLSGVAALVGPAAFAVAQGQEINTPALLVQMGGVLGLLDTREAEEDKGGEDSASQEA